MTVTYWVLAALLSLFYLYSGAIKIVRSREQLLPMMQWVDTTPIGLVRVIGVIEILGALGLILPPATGIAPGLATGAAAGLLILQFLAVSVHLSRREGIKGIQLNLVLIAVTAVVTWLSTVWI